MTVSRRRLFSSLAIAGTYRKVAQAAEPAVTIDVLRNVSVAHGTNLSDNRLRIIEPVIKQRGPRLKALRDFEVDDMVAPTQGILNK